LIISNGFLVLAALGEACPFGILSVLWVLEAKLLDRCLIAWESKAGVQGSRAQDSLAVAVLILGCWDRI